MKESNTYQNRYAVTYANPDYDTRSSGVRRQRIVVIDVETTGLDPTHHEILEIGAVREDGATFEQMVQIRHPERIQFEAAKINQCHLWHPDCFEEIPVNSVLPYADRAIDMLLDWLDSYDPTSRWTVIGRNPRFDLGFLFAHGPENHRAQRRLYKYGLDLHDLVNWSLCFQGHDPLRLSKDEKYSVLGYAREPIPHRALQGAQMEWMQMHSARASVFVECDKMPFNLPNEIPVAEEFAVEEKSE